MSGCYPERKHDYSRVRRHGVRVGGGEHDSVLAHGIVLVGKRLDQAARPSFKARPSILGGQFQNPLPWDHGDPGKQHGFGLLHCLKLSVEKDVKGRLKDFMQASASC